MRFQTRDNQVGQFEEHDPNRLLKEWENQLSSFRQIRRVQAGGEVRANGLLPFPRAWSRAIDAA
jgi:hypothetical protein